MLCGSVALLNGCFYIPVSTKIVNGPQPRTLAKPTDLKPQLTVGKTSRSGITAYLGPPQDSAGEQDIFYVWDVREGYMIYPLCFAAEPDEHQITARFVFDDKDVLVGYSIRNGSPGAYGGRNIREYVRGGDLPEEPSYSQLESTKRGMAIPNGHP
jgi:hypothetical protein